MLGARFLDGVSWTMTLTVGSGHQQRQELALPSATGCLPEHEQLIRQSGHAKIWKRDECQRFFSTVNVVPKVANH